MAGFSMRLLLLIFVGVVIAILAAPMIQDRAYVAFAFGEYVVELNMLLFIFCSIVLFGTGYFLLRLIGIFWRLPKWLSYRFGLSREWRAGMKLSQGVEAWLRDRTEQAERYFGQAADMSASTKIFYLLAARLTQNPSQFNKYLYQADQALPQAKVLIAVLQAERQMQQNDYQQAFETLQPFYETDSKNPKINRLMLEISLGLQNWDEAIKLLTYRIGKQSSQSDYLAAYEGKLREVATQNDVKKLAKVWNSIPKRFTQLPELILLYGNLQIKFGEVEYCEKLLGKALKFQWDSRLVKLYGALDNPNSKQQFSLLESFLKKYSHDPDLMLVLGQLSLKNQLWGKASEYFRRSLDIEENAEAYYELAKIYQQDNKLADAAEYYQKAISIKLIRSSD